VAVVVVGGGVGTGAVVVVFTGGVDVVDVVDDVDVAGMVSVAMGATVAVATVVVAAGGNTRSGCFGGTRRAFG
jgi:hypothetical protein